MYEALRGCAVPCFGTSALGDFPIISADSHITEPPNTYIDYIDAKFKDSAPRMVRDEEAGDLFVIEGMSRPVAMGLVSDGNVLEVATSSSGSWTIVVTLPTGLSCAVAAGEKWARLGPTTQIASEDEAF